MPRRPKRRPEPLHAHIFAGPGARLLLDLAKRGHSHNQPAPSRSTKDRGRFVLPQKLPKRWSTK
jgi:hypothetical protein